MLDCVLPATDDKPMMIRSLRHQMANGFSNGFAVCGQQWAVGTFSTLHAAAAVAPTEPEQSQDEKHKKQEQTALARHLDSSGVHPGALPPSTPCRSHAYRAVMAKYSSKQNDGSGVIRPHLACRSRRRSDCRPSSPGRRGASYRPGPS